MEFINYLENIEIYLDDCESEAVKDVLNTLSEEDIIVVYNYGCSAGVGGFIYYYETELFFDKHDEEVLDNINLMAQEYGIDFFKNFEFTKNNLTWLFVERVVNEFICFMEMNGYVKENDEY